MLAVSFLMKLGRSIAVAVVGLPEPTVTVFLAIAGKAGTASYRTQAPKRERAHVGLTRAARAGRACHAVHCLCPSLQPRSCRVRPAPPSVHPRCVRSRCRDHRRERRLAGPRLRVSGSRSSRRRYADPAARLQLGEWDQWLPTDGTDNVADGANVVRIPLRWWGQRRPDVDSYDSSMDSLTHLDMGHLQDLDDAIQHAAADHLWIVLFIDSNNGQGANDFPDNFFSGTATGMAMREEFKTVWTTIATRYKDQPWLGALEILPEPRPAQNVDDSVIRDFYDEMIGAIRTVDTRTPIIVGGQDAYSPRRSRVLSVLWIPERDLHGRLFHL